MKKNLNARERLIVALDCPSQDMARSLVRTLGDEVIFYKVGWQLFLQGGLGFVRELQESGKDVFLDLKMDDIEETIESAVREISGLAKFLTIHGNGATARAACAGRGNSTLPKLLSVTLLSSLDQADLQDLFGGEAPKLNDYVLFRAGKALESGCEGVIASGQTIKLIRDKFGDDPIIVSPGIRPIGSSTDDHKRSLTPSEALLNGADCLVIGRPIHSHPDPKEAVQVILAEMESALGSN